jgi:hypothetical protein
MRDERLYNRHGREPRQALCTAMPHGGIRSASTAGSASAASQTTMEVDMSSKGNPKNARQKARETGTEQKREEQTQDKPFPGQPPEIYADEDHSDPTDPDDDIKSPDGEFDGDRRRGRGSIESPR